MTSDVTRRTVLRAGAASATVGLAAAASGSAAADGSGEDGGSDEKRGGRAQLDGDARRGDTFTVGNPEGVSRNASCDAEASAQQTYLEYDVEFCDSDEEATLFVIPDEAELADDEVYVVNAIRRCHATDNDLVVFGPAEQSEC